MRVSGNKLGREALVQLSRRLPPGWRVGEPVVTARGLADFTVELIAPSGDRGVTSVQVKARLDPKGVRSLVLPSSAVSDGPLLVVSRYLSEATRALLRERDIGYLDLTGNVRCVMSTPGLYIETAGASEDPDRKERPARSLRGDKAGRVVRALCDTRELPGVRELAALTDVTPGYVSRVLTHLDSEALVTRVGRGQLASVDWPALLRRWAQDAPLESRGNVSSFLDPRGLPALLARLPRAKERYAVTGGLAAAALAPIAPPRLAVIWVRDAAEAAAQLDLRPASSGANVLLVEPTDDGVFEGATQRDEVWYAAPSQVAADLLTSPGRGPAEGDELIQWMQANEEAWRR
ncbi:MAG: hypothetical protein R3B40_25610 [Polyangiales bacterium]|nr:hypothetical protein [Myxococcales bacterium]